MGAGVVTVDREEGRIGYLHEFVSGMRLGSDASTVAGGDKSQLVG